MGKSFSNAEMEDMLSGLAPLLERDDIIGYAAARNTSALRGELAEYLKMRERLIEKHGEDVFDGDGVPTGVKRIGPDSPNAGAFLSDLAPLAAISHEPRLMRLPYAEAIGKLTGSRLLELDWMFEEAE